MEPSKAYNPKETEEKIYRLWLKSGFFNPDKLPGNRKKSFTIVLPPPNITGTLHMGHALNATIQDILIRWRRMQGYKTLWVPGTDHAGIAGQNVLEKALKKEGLTRFDLGREKFTERMWQWKEQYGNIILDQLKKLGASCDWSRTRFTMDDAYTKAVIKAFEQYYKKGWIYQSERTINWCTRCSTSLSDLEIVYQEEPAEFYYIKYGPITIATVRPETKLGDTAIAVNPKDPRYKEYVGKTIDIQTVLGPAKMRVIGDESVDMQFGTGAMKVTPAHDIHDFELGEKHGLAKKQVIGPDGRMTQLAGKYAGLTVMEARKQITEEMKNIGILEKIEPYTHNAAKCYRCNTTLEPILSKQWFLKMDELAKTAISSVKSGKIKFRPKRWERIYLDWLHNVKDWCISRQIWWGHKIPIEGTNDVLDTWFSSALWPFAVLGWPQNSKDLKQFYPTDVLVTDRGIINLWVARMIFSGMEFMRQKPFKDIYINATVLTKDGKRMSKSLGTGIDPLEMVDRYGADATRFGLAWQITELQDIKFGEDNLLMGKKFCNKLWNASKFVLQQTAASKRKGKIPKPHINASKFTTADKKAFNALNKTITSVNNDLEHFKFGAAAQKLYHFFWHDFCDKYIEASKVQMQDKRLKKQTENLLLHLLLTSLKLLHPFIPFVTEEIHQQLPLQNKKTALIVEKWPIVIGSPNKSK